MSIIGIVGKPKEGKTLFMRALMQYSCYDDVYCNIKIKGCPYFHIGSINDIYAIEQDVSRTKGIFLDEVNQMGADSWSYDKLAEIIADRFGTQHRKFRSDVFFTQQRINMVLNRIRENISVLYRPVNIFFDDNGKPSFIKVLIVDYDIYGVEYYKKSFWFPLFRDVGGERVYSCDLYNTYELVRPMEKVNVTISGNMKDKYGDFNLVMVKKDGSVVTNPDRARDLRSILCDIEKVSKVNASDIVNVIAFNQKLKAAGFDSYEDYVNSVKKS